MSARLRAVAAARAAAKSAADALKTGRADVLRSERTSEELGEKKAALRAKLVADRVASTSGGSKARGSSAAELLELDLDIEAAEIAVERAKKRLPHLTRALEQAEAKYNAAVCEFLREEVETPVIAAIENHLEQIFAVATRAIAAAAIAQEHGETWGSAYCPMTRSGVVGTLVDELMKVECPKHPRSIRPVIPKKQFTTDTPADLPGVQHAKAELSRLIEGAA